MAEAGGHHPAPGGDGSRSRTATAIGIGISVGVLIAAAITAAFVLPILTDDDGGGEQPEAAATYTSTRMECTPGTYVTRLGVVFPGPAAKEQAAALKQTLDQRVEKYKADVEVLVSEPQDTCAEGTEDKKKELTVLHVGPFPTKEQAQAVCAELRFGEKDCYVRLIEEAPPAG